MKNENIKTILISGATGTIGKKLCLHLASKGYEIHALSRQKLQSKIIKYFVWDPSKKTIDKEALEGVDAIIHLAGEGIVDKRWTDERKQQLIASRVESAELLLHICRENHVNLKKFVSASGVGFYGTHSNYIFSENDGAGNDFLSKCCLEWERAAHDFETITDVAILRLGVVLDKNGGALPKLAMPVKYFVGSALADGKQAMPWVSIDDVCNAFEFALLPSINGIYNVVAENHCTNESFVRTLGKVLRRPIIFPKVPAFVLQLMLGESSIAITKGQFVSNQKIKAAGFHFKHSKLSSTLEDLYAIE
jgi:uncharacterized protein (TIGR01777 family)